MERTRRSVCSAERLTLSGISGESITPRRGSRYLGTTSLMESLTKTWLQYSLISPFSQSARPVDLGK